MRLRSPTTLESSRFQRDLAVVRQEQHIHVEYGLRLKLENVYYRLTKRVYVIPQSRE